MNHVRFLASAGISLILTAESNAEGIHGRLHLVGITNNRFVTHRPDKVRGPDA